jgi:hypothetical protein
MEWVIALILVMLMPLGLIFWWVPRCDDVGIRIAHDRIARELAPATLAYQATSSPSRTAVPRAQEKVLDNR